VSRPVGQDPADEVARHQSKRRFGHCIEDREPGPFVELDSARRVGCVTGKAGMAVGAEDLLGVAQVERFEDMRERWVAHVVQQPDGAEGEADDALERRPQCSPLGPVRRPVDQPARHRVEFRARRRGALEIADDAALEPVPRR
jgi:hypothetical protein